ncbi:MAG: O-antigen ligase family protein [Parvibaculum sp.]
MDGWTFEGNSRATARRASFNWGETLGDIFVFLVIFSSFYQKSTPGESQPVLFDLLLIACMGAYFAFGLKIPRGLVWPVSMWGLVLTGYGIGGMSAQYGEKVRAYLEVATYLTCAFIFFTSYIFASPERRMRVIFNAYAAAGIVAACFGVVGYFGVDQTGLSVTVFGRATGTFNDPNVYGPYLIAPTLYLGLRLSKAKGPAGLLLVPLVGILVLGLLLSFSRGAWGSFLLSGAIFVGLTLATSHSAAQSARLVAFAGFMGLMVVGVVGAALSTPKVQQLFEQRATLVQSYDEGQGGRFESQRMAFVMGVKNPLGIGPEQWAMINKLDTHNVYLNIFVAGGFLSAFGFLSFLAMTFVKGKRAIFALDEGQDYLIVAYACIVGTMAEAFIIDVDNWRHLFLLLGVTWGGILAVQTQIKTSSRPIANNHADLISGFTA